MADPVQFRRASAAQAKLPPPQKQVEDDLAAKLGNDGKSLHLLMKHAQGAAFWRGAVVGGALMLIAGAMGTLAITTALFDPISKSAGQNVATGAAIAARDAR